MILRLLRLEYKKFRKNSVISMLVGMFLIFFPIAIFFFEDVELPIPGFTKDSIFGFPGIWEYMGYEGSWMIFFFFGFITVHMITSEVSNKTLRQNIITGLNRNEYFIAKLSGITVLSLFATFYYFISAFAVGWFSTENPSLSLAFEMNYAVPKFLLMTFGFLSLALMIGFVIRKSGLAVLSYLSYVLFLEPLIKLFHIQMHQSKYVNYWPANIMEDLMPFPLWRFAENIPRKDISYNFLLSAQEAVIGTILYSLLFIGLAWMHFKKADI